MSIGVLLADDQELMRMGFRMVLEAQPDMEVVGEAASGREAVEAAERLRPEVVLMDVRMPDMDGIAATAEVLARVEGARVIILTTFDLDDYLYPALRAGASGFLLKDAQPADLIAAVRAVASGDAVMAPRVTRRLLARHGAQLRGPASDEQGRLRELTPREREVMLEVARGRSNGEIAGRLFLSEATVKTHVGRILFKLSLRDRVQIVILAYETGLIQPGDEAPAVG